MKRVFFLLALSAAVWGLGMGCRPGELRRDRGPSLSFPKTVREWIPDYYRGHMPSLLSAAPSSASPAALTVSAAGSFAPSASGSSASGFYWVFSQPMVPSGRVGRPFRRLPGLTLSPPLPGSFYWTGTQTLVFVPTPTRLHNRLLKATLSPAVASLSGCRLGGEGHTLNLAGEGVEVVDFWSGKGNSLSVRQERSRIRLPKKALRSLYLEIKQAPPPALIRERLSLRVGGRRLPLRLVPVNEGREDPSLYFYRLRLRGSVQSIEAGSCLQLFWNELPLDGRRVEVARPFEFSRIGSDWDYRRLFRTPEAPEVRFVSIESSTPVRLSSLTGRVTVNGRPVSPDQWAQRGNRLLFLGTAEPGETELSFLFQRGISDRYGRTLAADCRLSTAVPPSQPYWYAPYSGRNLLFSRQPLLHAETGIPAEGGWRLTPLNEQLRPIPAAAVSVPWKGDAGRFPFHAVADLGPLSKAERGNAARFWTAEPYWVPSASFRPSLPTEAFRFQLTSTGLTLLGTSNRLLGLVTSLETGKRLSSGEGSLTLLGKKYPFVIREGAFECQTDPSVSLRLHPFLLELQTGEDALRLTVDPKEGMQPDPGAFDGGDLTRPSFQKAFLLPDRPIYRAGERLSFVAADFHSAFDPSSPARVELTQLFPYERLYYRELLPVRSKEEASFFASGFFLPASLPSGDYQLSYIARESRATARVTVVNETLFCSLSADKAAYVAGEAAALRLDRHSNADAPLPAETEAVISVETVPLDPRLRLSQWKESFIGLLHPPQTESRRRFSVSLREGDAAPFYQRLSDAVLKRQPCRLSFSPSVSFHNRRFGGSGVSVDCYPAGSALEARWLRTPYPNSVVRGKKAVLEYRLLSVADGSDETEAGKPITLELVSVGPSEEITQVLFSGTRPRKRGVQHFSVVWPHSGCYRFLLRSEDASGNAVVTELPLYVLGESTHTDSFEVEALQPRGQVGKTAALWVNVPLPPGGQLSSRAALVKERADGWSLVWVAAESGSRVVEIPVEAEDFPELRLHWIGWNAQLPFPEGKRLPKGTEGDAFGGKWETRTAWTVLRVDPAVEASRPLSIGGLSTLQAGGKEEITLCPNGGASDRGRVSSVFWKEREPFPESEGEFRFEVAEGLFSPEKGFGASSVEEKEPLWLEDSRRLLYGGKVHRSPPPHGLHPAVSSLRTPFECRWTPPLPVTGGKTTRFPLSVPAEAGRYRCLFFGEWKGEPFWQMQTVDVVAPPQVEWELPESLFARDFVEGRIFLKPWTLPNEAFSLSVEVSVADSHHREVHLPPICLSKANRWQSTLPFSAQQAGEYRFRATLLPQMPAAGPTPAGPTAAAAAAASRFALSGGETAALPPPRLLRVLPSAAASAYPVEFMNRSDSFPFTRLNAFPDFSLFATATLNDPILQIWKAAEAALHPEDSDPLLKSKINAVFFPLIAARIGEQYGVPPGLSRSRAMAVIESVASMQNADGGYSLLNDPKAPSDYYTTLRIADALQLPSVNAYSHAIVWSLLQYLKMPFKGLSKARHSVGVSRYALWVLAHYEENIILMAKNALESPGASLGEALLTGLAMIESGRALRTEVRPYLEALLQQTLYAYDSRLPQPAVASPPEAGYLFSAPEAEAALAFLFLEAVGGQREAASAALQRLLQGRSESFSELDAEFILKALTEAHRKGLISPKSVASGTHSLALTFGRDELLRLEAPSGKAAAASGRCERYRRPTRVRRYGKLLSDAALWEQSRLVWHHPVEGMPSGGNGYQLWTEWQDEKGHRLDGEAMERGKRYRYVIRFSALWDRGPFRLTLPNRFASVFRTETLIGGLDSAESGSQRIPTASSESEILWIGSDCKQGMNQLIVTVTPLFAGIYPFPSVSVESLLNPARRAESGGSLLRVKP